MVSHLKKNLALSLTVFALIISPLVVLATSNISLYALSLPILFFLFWWLSKISLKEIGLSLAKPIDYLYAILYPIIVLSIVAFIAYFWGGAMPTGEFPVSKLFLALLIDVPITALFLIPSEEGIFRGLLWGLLKKENASLPKRVVLTSFLFALWHIPVLTLFAETKIDLSSLPFYLINAFVVGMLWSLLRAKSGSILPLCISHAVWNTFAYALFGYGANAGMLGVPLNKIYIFDPERGILGAVLNIGALVVIYFLIGRKLKEKV